jgi:hypothetical protein
MGRLCVGGVSRRVQEALQKAEIALKQSKEVNYYKVRLYGPGGGLRSMPGSMDQHFHLVEWGGTMPAMMAWPNHNNDVALASRCWAWTGMRTRPR